jgi:PIN domain nuclease of toxin-antitoxin system
VRILLDTHALLWWLVDHPKLSVNAQAAISTDAESIYVSAASVWEIATKTRLGKLEQANVPAADITAQIVREGFLPLPVTIAHGQAAGALPGPHRDPFDRMLIAQATIEDMVLLSNERAFDFYGVKRLW